MIATMIQTHYGPLADEGFEALGPDLHLSSTAANFLNAIIADLRKVEPAGPFIGTHETCIGDNYLYSSRWLRRSRRYDVHSHHFVQSQGRIFRFNLHRDASVSMMFWDATNTDYGYIYPWPLQIDNHFETQFPDPDESLRAISQALPNQDGQDPPAERDAPHRDHFIQVFEADLHRLVDTLKDEVPICLRPDEIKDALAGNAAFPPWKFYTSREAVWEKLRNSLLRDILIYLRSTNPELTTLELDLFGHHILPDGTLAPPRLAMRSKLSAIQDLPACHRIEDLLEHPAYAVDFLDRIACYPQEPSSLSSATLDEDIFNSPISAHERIEVINRLKPYFATG